jgi:hypothetical protein
MDGILGLAPNIADNGPSYVQSLKEQGFIDKMEISFFLSQKSQSTFTFGPFDEELLMNKTEGIHWLELTGKSWWQVEI